MLASRVVAGLLATATLAFSASAQAATITAVPFDEGGANDGICELREAIKAANTNAAAGGTDCPAGQPTATAVDVIQLPAGTYDLGTTPATLPRGDDANVSGDLDITEALTINGAGAATTIIDAHGRDRVIQTFSGAPITINGVTIQNGVATAGTNGAANQPGAGGERGGGIYAFDNLTLDHVTVTNNSSGNGGNGGFGVATAGAVSGEGGGIWSLILLTMTDSVVSNNTTGNGGNGSGAANCSSGPGGSGGAALGGGGILAANSGAIILRSTITGNHTGSGGAGWCGTTPGAGGSGGQGAGLFVGNLVLTDSTVTDNHTGTGGSAGMDWDGANSSGSGSGGSGGGISAYGNIAISGTVIDGNTTADGVNGTNGTDAGVQTANGGGGGAGAGAVLAPSSFNTATVTNSTFSNNHTGNAGFSTRGFPGTGGPGGGLAMLAPAGVLTITNTTVTGNTTGHGGNSSFQQGPGGAGGGIYVAGSFNDPAALNVTNTTVQGNTAGAGGNQTAGPGSPGGYGGGIGVGDHGELTLTHTTVAGNTAGTDGTGTGGTPAFRLPNSGAIGVFHSFNTSSATVKNSILSSNLPGNCDSTDPADFVDGGHNDVFGGACSPLTGITTDPLLVALADNGGPTKTMALPENSPARETVPSSDAGCTATDQRGTARPQGTECDAGAFEFVPVPPIVDPGTGAGGTDPGTQPPGDSGTQPSGGTTTPPPADKTPPKVALKLTKQKLKTILKKGFLITFTTNEIGKASAALGSYGKGKLTIKAVGKNKFVVKLTKKAKKKLKKAKKLKVTLVLKVTDAAGNLTTVKKKLTLKR